MNFQNEKFEELSKLLKDALAVYEADRELAIKNYNDMKKQLENVLDQDFEMSQDGILEAKVNDALKLVFAASSKLDKVISQVSGIIKIQMTNESREKIAQTFSQGGTGNLIPKGAVNFREIQQRKQQELTYEDEDDQ